jgi:hypothetical protein
MHRASGEGFEDEHVEGSLDELATIRLSHRCLMGVCGGADASVKQ